MKHKLGKWYHAAPDGISPGPAGARKGDKEEVAQPDQFTVAAAAKAAAGWSDTTHQLEMDGD
jgi:hypothetical protein